MGGLAGAVDENRGPHLTVGSAHPTERAFTLYRFRTRARWPGRRRISFPSAASSPSAPAWWGRFEKFPRWSRSKQSRGRRDHSSASSTHTTSAHCDSGTNFNKRARSAILSSVCWAAAPCCFVIPASCRTISSSSGGSLAPRAFRFGGLAGGVISTGPPRVSRNFSTTDFGIRSTRYRRRFGVSGEPRSMTPLTLANRRVTVSSDTPRI